MPYRTFSYTDIRPNPPLFFANIVATGAAGGGTAMSVALAGLGVSLSTIGALREGVLIKNLSGNTMAFLDIFGTSGDSGGNKKYSIGGGNEGITLGVYGR